MGVGRTRAGQPGALHRALGARVRPGARRRVHHLVGLREDTDHKDEQFGDVTRASSDAIGRALVGRAEMPAAVLTEDVQRRLGCQSDGSQLGTPSDGSGAPVGGLGSGGGSFASGDAEGDVVAEVWATEELRIRWGSRRGTGEPPLVLSSCGCARGVRAPQVPPGADAGLTRAR